MKSALFVDFDNVYSGLRQLDQASADRFALKPMEWMNWVINSLELPEHVPVGSRRRVLVRRCYLNPQAYQRFRPSFNLAGFEIIDCPALTSGGKTSTDIHMVLDIIDLLSHEAHYDEFIVFSADADFTPVLRKLRRWDRRTTVLAIGFPSAAYRASADLLIDQDDFVRNALGSSDEPKLPLHPPVAPPRSTSDVAQDALKLVRDTVAASATPVGTSRLASLVLSEVEGLDASTWAGFGNFRKLIESQDLSPLVLSWDGGGSVFDPRRHAPPKRMPSAQPDRSREEQELSRITDLIKRIVTAAEEPVPCGKLATMITNQHGSIAEDWNGKGTFRKFIESLDVPAVQFDWNASGGCAHDPRHGLAREADEQKDALAEWESDQELLRTAKQIHEVTGVPLLSPRKYRSLFAAIAADVAVRPFDFIESGKSIRDRCKESAQPVSRADVTFVLRGLLVRGHAFDKDKNEPHHLGQRFADNVRSLCLREQIVLDRLTEDAIGKWICASE
jgi:hypothetical protein